MKAVYLFLIAMGTVLLVSHAKGAEWVYMGTDELIGIEWSYDVETLSESQTGKTKVWILSEYSDEGRKKEIQWRISEGLEVKGFDTLSHNLSLCEVNCITREYRLMETSYCSTDGQVLYSHTYNRQPAKGWRPVPLKTIAEKLYQALCPSQEKK